jgi:predicted N-acetyltransferase YhbS
VEGDSQRQGIGRSLIGAATDYVRTRQPPVRVLTVASTPNAIDAYRRMGFVPVGSEQVLKGIRFVSCNAKPLEKEDHSGAGKYSFHAARLAGFKCFTRVVEHFCFDASSPFV